MRLQKQTKTRNPEIINLLRLLRNASGKNDSSLWRDISRYLSKSKRQRVAVNIGLINRYSQKDDELVVPGKVLGSGSIDHPVKVAAYAFSDKARNKILEAKGKCLSISELVESNPKGSNVKIIR